MLSSILFFVPLLSLAEVSATTLAPRSIHQLLSRQTTLDPSIIPAQCKAQCATVVSTVATCQPPAQPSCGCSIAEERGFVNCLNCLFGLGTPSQASIDSAQSSVDQYVQLCNRAGVPLPATTIRGGVTEITSTSGNTPTSVISLGRPPSATLGPTPITTRRQSTFTGLDPAETEAADDSAPTSNPGSPFGDEGKNGASRRALGREAAAAAVAATIALLVFF
ncbi:hypothetical protein D9615_003254 [Tricholomella constricta]|uniref:Uncharacterized protein n=1 Tax=Tricholomella constricta TaxID=117010 RepID=A0A8H5HJM3_9AGAR|nr:hypothetical protein D9615_003254 [Tricholomella constricta]